MENMNKQASSYDSDYDDEDANMDYGEEIE